MAKVLPMTTEHIAHFSSLEASFFKEGDDLANGQPGFDESDEPTRVCKPRRLFARQWFARRWPLVGLSVGVVCVLGLVLLGQAHRKTMPQPAEPTTLAAVVAVPLTKIPAAAEAEIVAETTPEPPAPAPVAVRQEPSPSQATTGAVAAVGPQEDTFETCRKAFDQHRAKDVLSTCPQAIDATPQSAELAVILARTEFERGRARQALDWAKKAVALDAERAEAYVYLGGAEQAAGRAAAAKAAYRRYLQLAPQGRHAADLRAVLANL